MAKRKRRLIRVKAAKFHIFTSAHMLLSACVCVCPVWRNFNEIVQMCFWLSNTFRIPSYVTYVIWIWHIWRVSFEWGICYGWVSLFAIFKLGYLIINEVILQPGVVWVRLQLNSVLSRNCRRHGLCLGLVHFGHAPDAYSILQVFYVIVKIFLRFHNFTVSFRRRWTSQVSCLWPGIP